MDPTFLLGARQINVKLDNRTGNPEIRKKYTFLDKRKKMLPELHVWLIIVTLKFLNYL